MKRPPKSEAVRKAKRERDILTLRWAIAGCCGLLGAFLGPFVFYWILEMDHPPDLSGDPGAGGFWVWWYEFANRWKIVLASATSGTLGILLPALTFWGNRKEVATLVLGQGILAIIMLGLLIAWNCGYSAWEVTLPALLCSLGVSLLLGFRVPPVPEDPLIRKHAPSALPASPSSVQDPNEVWSLSHTSTQQQFVDDTIALHYLPGVLTILRVFKSIGILLVFLLLHFLVPDDLPQRTLLLGAGATAWVLVSWLRHVPRLRRRITKASTEKLGLSFPIHEYWQMNGDGLTYRVNEMEAKLLWAEFKTFTELQDGFHMEFEESNMACIPFRAFADAKEQRRWRTRIKSHSLKESDS